MSQSTQSSTALDPAVLGAYAVLRRPASAADQPPAINTLGLEIGSQLGAYNPRSIRLLSGASAEPRYFLFPGFLQAIAIPPARCLPPAMRRHRTALVLRERRRTRQPGFCIGEVSGRGRLDGAGSCHLFSEVASYDQFVSAGPPGSGAAIVPDGVVRVRFVMRSGPAQVVQVNDNFLTFGGGPRQRQALKRLSQLGRRLVRFHPSKAGLRRRERTLSMRAAKILYSLTPARVDWLGADGQIMRSFKPPPRREAQFFSING